MPKKYKPTYSFTFLIDTISCFIALAVIFFIVSFYFVCTKVFEPIFLLIIPLGIIAFYLQFLLWAVLYHFIAKKISKTQVELYDEYFIVNDREINIDSISYIYFEYGYIGKHSSKPYEVTIFYDDNKSVKVKRLSLSFLKYLKKVRKIQISSEYTLKQKIKKDIKFFLIITIIIFAIIYFMSISGCEFE